MTVEEGGIDAIVGAALRRPNESLRECLCEIRMGRAAGILARRLMTNSFFLMRDRFFAVDVGLASMRLPGIDRRVFLFLPSFLEFRSDGST
ncbi:MAG: hypothetical protein OZ935_14990 [Pseudomonadota bacterium]|nr:hypothetical protein [Pseudomonadota bacterium]